MGFNFFQYWIYDVIFLIAFCLFVGIFLYKRRKNLQRDGIMYLYRTKVGIKFIDYVGENYPKTLSVFGFLSIVSGYFLMVIMIFMLGLLVKTYLFNPSLVRTIKIAPLMPLIPYVDTIFKVSFLPPFYFTYWIIAIAVIALFHEFSHGIMAKRYGVKIKTTGFGFLGPFLAAFVEPDEKKMQKKGKYQQLSILAAGTFANLLLAILFFVLLSVFFVISYAPSGTIVGGYIAEPVKISAISSIGGIAFSNLTKQDIAYALDNKNISDDILIDISGHKEPATKIIVDNRTYYMTKELLKAQLNVTNQQLILFPSLPAIESGIRSGEIIFEINNEKIGDINDLSRVLNKSKVGEVLIVKTRYNNSINEYELTLGQYPAVNGKAVVGIVFSQTDDSRLMVKISNFFNFFKKPSTYYSPRFNNNLIIFIYNLIWWLALINLSVALMNMLPVGIFDGGRFFMLSVWGITKNEKVAAFAFKVTTYLILFAFFMLMAGWASAMFFK
ncbi:site-2 protease family protein [Candidatus Pacearchaeota archaeon]|nr:site-2 protease family protein [Candidatus Pacearchaeota archaeon]